MNLLQGDHMANSMMLGHVVAATFEPHDAGSPCTTLVQGRAYDSYNFRTADVFGVNASAE